MEPNEIGLTAAKIAKDKKATRVVVLDLKGQSDVCSCMVICSVQNDRQAKAIAEAMDAELKSLDIKALAIEGKQSGQWVLLDFGSTLVHIFLDHLRDYYALEKLFPDAEFISPKP